MILKDEKCTVKSPTNKICTMEEKYEIFAME